MEVRYSGNPRDVKKYGTQELRENFLIETLMELGKVHATYSLDDRMIVMGVVPEDKPIQLPVYEEMTKAEYFLQRREMGIINVGGSGTVKVDGQVFELGNKECLYVGLGRKEVVFESKDSGKPAEFYINSCPAHKEYPIKKASLDDANRVELGSLETSNERTIFQFIHENGIQSCQLVMGFTELKKGSVWNTFPPHTHLRRMESYFYFNLPENQIVVHFMGEPNETRHIIMKNKQAVISPSWSIHSGAGTSAYCFIWAMAGENKAFTDMDGVSLNNIR